MVNKQRAQHLVQSGMQHHQAGRFEQAAASYRQALSADGRNPDALNLMGVLLRQQNRCADALDYIKRAIGIQPKIADYHFNLAEAYRALNRPDDAITAYNNAIQRQPRDPEFLHGLGMALEMQGRFDEAVERYRQSIRVQPSFVPGHTQLVILLLKQAQVPEALAVAQQAIALAPDLPETQFALGAALEQMRQFEPAEACYRRTIELKPDHASAHNQLGIVLKDTGRYTQAVQTLRAGLQIRPDDADLHGNIANALVDCGRLDEAVTEYRKALSLNPNHSTGHSNLLLALNYRADITPQQLLAEHVAWAQRHAAPLGNFIRPHQIDRTPGRRLRIGYVSPDFREHSVAHFIGPVIAAHDHGRFEIFAYAHIARPDSTTATIRKNCDQWRDTMGVSDEQVAEMIRRDRIDILIDVAGHTGSNRLHVFARKPAPVQMTYLGYPATTGLTTIDYRITDEQADPPGMTDANYSEKLLRVPECFLCYAPPHDAPPVAPLPALANGHITFASFNNLAKLVPPVIQTWAQILHAVPNARLILKAKGLHDPGVQEDVRQRFAQHGIAADRIELLGATMPFLRHLEQYGRVDLALDSFPYNGTTTTCEAMWMGVPVIALAGQTHAARVGVSLLTNTGLTELIAPTQQAYIELAVNLSRDVARLQDLRTTLRLRMQASALMNPHRLTRALEDLYGQAWQRV